MMIMMMMMTKTEKLNMSVMGINEKNCRRNHCVLRIL